MPHVDIATKSPVCADTFQDGAFVKTARIGTDDLR
jgi:hypothetical protein